jgi:hypothetical protein
MRALSPNQFFACAGTTSGNFGAYTSRNEVALAFGLARRLEGGVFLDLDAVAVLVVDELANAFGRQIAATIVRAHSDALLGCVGQADAQREPVFLAIGEYGEAIRHKHFGPGRAVRDRQRVGMFSGFPKFFEHPEMEVPARLTLVNISDILARVRANAAKIGVDLGAPFFPPPDDPFAEKVLAAAKKEREAALRLYHQHRMASTMGKPAGKEATS